MEMNLIFLNKSHACFDLNDVVFLPEMPTVVLVNFLVFVRNAMR